jgi:hypothetical protein
MGKLTLGRYQQTLLIAIASLTPITSACLPGADAFWIVRENEYTAQAAQHLGVPVEVIVHKNSAMQPDLVLPGETYVVPYTSCVQAPATWSVTEVTSSGTSSCIAFLLLGEHTTTAGDVPEHMTPIVSTNEASTTAISSKPADRNHSKDETTSQTTLAENTHQSSVTTKTPAKITSIAPTETKTLDTGHTTTLIATLSPTPLVTTVEVVKTVSYTEEQPPAVFNEGERYCYNGEEAWSGTDETVYVAASEKFCQLSRNPLNNANNRSFVRVMETGSKAYPYALFSLFWNNLDSACSQPDAVETDTSICSSLMLDNFKKCKYMGFST